MKAVLISIQPKWCELIASGKKIVEVRKTKPKIETPFKCYIYCTSSNVHECLMQNEGGVKLIYACNYKTAIPCGGHIANGKVIGEFVCDRITEYECSSDGFGELATTCGTCLTYDEIINYCNGNELYGWHITDLVIYDKPRELSEFKALCGNKGRCASCKKLSRDDYTCEHKRGLARPPQSWCYVEELKGK